MEQPRKKLHLLLGCFLPVIFILTIRVSGLQTFVCSPSSTSEPLSCTDRQWVRIVAEIYAPQTGQGSRCQQNISACNAYLYDTGMLANCNGPARAGGCREAVDVEAARRVTRCLQDVTDVATLIQYNCIEGSSVLNLCEANITMWTSDLPLYLASPGYGQSTHVGKMCTCEIQGSNLKMNAVEINVMSKLAWGDDVTDKNNYSDVFAVSSVTTALWRSSNCAGCTMTNLVNSNLFLPVDGTRYSNITVTYSDFGVSGQNVWVEIFESGPSISVSCRSSLLPPDKLIITSSTAATTSTTTKGRVTTSHTSTPTPQEHRSNTPPTETVVSSMTPLMSTASSAVTEVTTANGQPPTPTSGDTKTTDAGVLNSGKQDDSDGELTLIVTLTVILCVLTVTAILLGVLIYRKRHILKSDDYISPWTRIVNWYHRLWAQKHKQGVHKDGGSIGNFDSVLAQDEPHQKDLSEAVSHLHSSDKPSADNTGPVQSPENTSVANSSALIPPELYQFHQRLLDEELDKMRRERSSKANIKMSVNESPGTCFSGSKSLKESGLREPGSDRRVLKKRDLRNDAPSMPGCTAEELRHVSDGHIYTDHAYTNDVSDDDSTDYDDEDDDGDDDRGDVNTSIGNADIVNNTVAVHRKDQAHLSSGEYRLFERLGINTDTPVNNVLGRLEGKNAPVSVDYEWKVEKEENIVESGKKKKHLPRSQESESSCKDMTILEPAGMFHNKRGQGSSSKQWEDSKVSRPDTVSDIIQKCGRDIKSRRNDMDLPIAQNTSSLSTMTKGDNDTDLQTSMC